MTVRGSLWLVVVAFVVAVLPELALGQQAGEFAGPPSRAVQVTIPAEGPAVAASTATDHPVWHVVTFYIFAGLTVVSALGICLSRNVVRMAIGLFATLGSIAMLYFLLAAPFLAVIQLIVYVGGTLVLLIFGVMLTAKSPWASFDVKRSELVLAGLVCVVLAAALIGIVLQTAWPTSGPTDAIPVAVIGQELLTTYLVPFEAVSVLLLVVMIGAAYLVRQEKGE
ncbi:MAG: NADH-quinone oxidoreductase subunit J [Planctomycetes bacterium]|nr:NADH-quinone oxidoreductase subunit J [Planctomycetota bacterium]